MDVSAHPFTAWIGPRRHARHDPLQRRQRGVAAELAARVRPRAVRAPDRPGARSARTSAAAPRCRCTSPRASCGRTTWRAAPRSRRCSPASWRPAALRSRAEELHATLVGVERSLIRVSADPLTYPLHIILRFELELRADRRRPRGARPARAPGARAMRRLLGLEVPSDALGCLQDVHWGAGSFGYFPSYALGCLIAAQLWEAIEARARLARGGPARAARSARSRRGSASAFTATGGAWTRCSSSSGRPARRWRSSRSCATCSRSRSPTPEPPATARRRPRGSAKTLSRDPGAALASPDGDLDRTRRADAEAAGAPQRPPARGGHLRRRHAADPRRGGHRQDDDAVRAGGVAALAGASPAERILLLTFTRRAAREMVERARALARAGAPDAGGSWAARSTRWPTGSCACTRPRSASPRASACSTRATRPT